MKISDKYIVGANQSKYCNRCLTSLANNWTIGMSAVQGLTGSIQNAPTVHQGAVQCNSVSTKIYGPMAQVTYSRLSQNRSSKILTLIRTKKLAKKYVRLIAKFRIKIRKICKNQFKIKIKKNILTLRMGCYLFV